MHPFATPAVFGIVRQLMQPMLPRACPCAVAPCALTTFNETTQHMPCHAMQPTVHSTPLAHTFDL